LSVLDDDLDWEFALSPRPGHPTGMIGGANGQEGKRRCDTLPILHPDAAGIDVGASELFVAVSADRDPHPVRSFPSFIRDLHALADWLEQVRDSFGRDGVYQRVLDIYQILEARGLEVYLVNAQHVKNVPDRKTDVSDCQWLQYLHSVGLLRASFRPPGFICAIFANCRRETALARCRELLGATTSAEHSETTNLPRCPACSATMLVIERFTIHRARSLAKQLRKFGYNVQITPADGAPA
jgi:hypothetical protein